MLFGAIALIAIGAILPTLPPSVFNQSQLQGNLTAGQAPVPADVPMVSQSLIGGIGIAFASSTVCYIHCLICGSLRATERSRMGVDRYCDLIHYQHRIKCNFNCYRQYSRDYQHYHQWNHPVLPIQTTCEGLFWQRSKPVSPCYLTPVIVWNHPQKERVQSTLLILQEKL
jgi:hypothetical protein